MPHFDGLRIFKGKSNRNRDLVIWDHSILVDTREQAPFHFLEMEIEDTKGVAVPFVVKTVRASLPSGDYSVQGFEHAIAIERKAFDDLYGTLGSGRERFENELYRLNQLSIAFVVTEAPWSAVMRNPDNRKLSPNSIYGSIQAWQMRYPRVHWWLCNNRRDAEITTFRLLKRFVENYQAEKTL
jgi:ERCC4-type nuclease